jgi:hypothetical protein
MPRLLQRFRARRAKRKARRRTRLADNHVRDVHRLAADAQQRRYKTEGPPYSGGAAVERSPRSRSSAA